MKNKVSLSTTNKIRWYESSELLDIDFNTFLFFSTLLYDQEIKPFLYKYITDIDLHGYLENINKLIRSN